jgi:hypothetical protein
MIKEISKKLNISEQEVKDVISHFFTNTKKSIAQGDRPIIRVPFGSFLVKPRRLNHYILNRVVYFKKNRDMFSDKNKEKLSKLLKIRNTWMTYKTQKQKQYNE